MAIGDVLVANATGIVVGDMDATIRLNQVLTGENAFVAGEEYIIKSMGNSTGVITDTGINDASAIGRASSSVTSANTLVAGTAFPRAIPGKSAITHSISSSF